MIALLKKEKSYGYLLLIITIIIILCLYGIYTSIFILYDSINY